MEPQTAEVAIKEHESATEVVAGLIAAEKDTDILNLTPLHDFIDTDGLNRLIENSRSSVSLTFYVNDLMVTVHGNQRVEIEETLTTPPG